MKPNWNKAPAWANWAAQDSFGGDWVYTQSYPKEQGVTNIWPRPSNPSDTIKELSEMCFGWEPVDHAAELAVATKILATVLIQMHGYTKKTPVVAQALAVVDKYKQSRGE